MPETGRDAFRAGAAILNAIYAEADALKTKKSRVAGIDHPTMIVGMLNGGINTNVVPDRLTLKMDRRMIPEEDPAEVEAGVRALIERAVAGHDGIRVEIRRLLLARALTPLPGQEKLVAAIQQHGKRVFGVDIPAVGVPLYADARLYAEHGVPIIMYGAGPKTIAESAKRPDENLRSMTSGARRKWSRARCKSARSWAAQRLGRASDAARQLFIVKALHGGREDACSTDRSAAGCAPGARIPASSDPASADTDRRRSRSSPAATRGRARQASRRPDRAAFRHALRHVP
jgi:hypothetical protein